MRRQPARHLRRRGIGRIGSERGQQAAERAQRPHQQRQDEPEQEQRNNDGDHGDHGWTVSRLGSTSYTGALAPFDQFRQRKGR
ncbi:hypothetical protein Ddc_24728 [Ditylenchus destructor]|nr:hypothetical protein Ddc_24728 [Ditylenchus destructor]